MANDIGDILTLTRIEYDADASQSSVQCSVSDHKLHSRVQEVATISDSDTEVEVIVTLPSDTALVVTFDNVGG